MYNVHVQRIFVVNHSTFFRYAPYLPWTIWLAKSRFYEYAWGRGDQYSFQESAYYN